MSKRTEIIRLVLTEEEKAAMKKDADAKGLPVAVWARMILIGAAKEQS